MKTDHHKKKLYIYDLLINNNFVFDYCAFDI